MASVIMNGAEFTEIKYVCGNETDVQNGILIHDLSDTYHDGDTIIGNNVVLPETEEDAAAILADTAHTSHWTFDDGIYRIQV